MASSSPRPDRYALVGHPVSHSRSPLIHQLFARQMGDRLTYELIDAEPDQFETAVLGFAAAGGRGMNVTVPHKEAAYELCRTHGAEAKTARAVNTISFKGGAPHGDNTDGTGFIRDLTVNYEREIAGKRVVLLGAGGAARGIVGPILAAGPAALVVANRTIERAEELRNDFGSPPELSICRFDELEDLGDCDIVINATSAGLRGEAPPFPDNLVGGASFCYDLAYSLKPTPFMRWAEDRGAGEAVQGWGMLVEQAADSYAIWRGKRPDTGPILSKLTTLTAWSRSPHGHELFRARRVNRDRIVEVPLARPERHRDGESLRHLVGAGADDMTADDPLVGAGDDELHRGPRLFLGDRIEHADEARGVRSDVRPVSRARILLREADRADRRMREDDGRNQIVAQLAVGHAAEQPIRQPPAGGNRNRRQLGAAGHVADRVDAGLRRRLIVVDGNVACFRQRDARVVETEIRNVRVTADRPQNGIEARMRAADRMKRQSTIRRQPYRLRLRDDLDPRGLHLLLELGREHRIEFPEQAIAADEHRNTAAEGPQNAGELHRDIAAADDGDARRQRIEREEAVRVDAEIGAVDAGLARLSAGRDHDMRRLVVLARRVDDAAGPVDAAGRSDVQDALFLEVAGINAVQPRDVGVARFLQRGEVVTPDVDVETVGRRGRELIG
jgi:shikimate dehydrogenase